MDPRPTTHDDRLFQDLRRALHEQNLTQARWLRRCGAPLQAMDGKPSLTHAVVLTSDDAFALEGLRWLMQEGLDVLAPDANVRPTWEALGSSVRRGLPRTVRWLLEQGADPHHVQVKPATHPKLSFPQQPLLVWAAQQLKHEDCLMTADEDPDGWRKSQERLDVVEALWAHGADLDDARAGATPRDLLMEPQGWVSPHLQLRALALLRRIEAQTLERNVAHPCGRGATTPRL